ncbi:TetR/AcrR family transcriptional regulator [Glutamicibacter sp. BSL13]|jgi:AcrR family transcriptional regulator
MTQPKETPLRADARRNRERILEAAVEALSRDSGASLSAIGKRAGVGQGTLYRHFPDREALIWAVYEREVDDLVVRADQLLEQETPQRALREWMSHLARFALTKADLGGAINEPISPETKAARPGYARVVHTIETLLAANREAGTIRPDATAQDFTALVAGLWQIRSDADGEQRAQRLLDLIVIALSAQADPAS